MTEPKILTFDIETTPNLAHVWGMWDQNVGLNQLVAPTEMVCFAAKWVDNKKIYFHSKWEDGHEGMVKAMYDLLEEADVVVGYNQRRFDVPHVNREFLLQDLSQPAPYQQIDLLTVVRNKFKFPSNKLDYVAKVTGVGQKVKHDGFDLWLGVMAGDPAAQAKMRQYNLGDVRITEKVYLALRDKGWINVGPNMAGFTGNEDGCPSCGGDHLQSRGYAILKSGASYQRFQCQDCFTWMRAARGDAEIVKPTMRQIAA